ncbi:uncharacterized protein BCR38DRAFT_411331 [Pseudomassariella vexata]|uniref:Uncharacterized protein n=1 Tax=Pseudomassariella vexata TaxID=1141098 RepID=A0A1Y2DQ93_9PEZI|nr:uncharacterized protein BCR38DRAFT_411331 [Pseudomassariella vexata]ORY61458.1 hypothetical protein BCR38DRAFT_411331 [Pseudomassariella vexata]
MTGYRRRRGGSEPASSNHVTMSAVTSILMRNASNSVNANTSMPPSTYTGTYIDSIMVPSMDPTALNTSITDVYTATTAPDTTTEVPPSMEISIKTTNSPSIPPSFSKATSRGITSNTNAQSQPTTPETNTSAGPSTPTATTPAAQSASSSPNEGFGPDQKAALISGLIIAIAMIVTTAFLVRYRSLQERERLAQEAHIIPASSPDRSGPSMAAANGLNDTNNSGTPGVGEARLAVRPALTRRMLFSELWPGQTRDAGRRYMIFVEPSTTEETTPAMGDRRSNGSRDCSPSPTPLIPMGPAGAEANAKWSHGR